MGASSLQPAVGVTRIQAAAPAPYYQPAAGLRAVQTVQAVNIAIVRNPAPAPKPRDNSTAMPVATVDAIGFLTKGASEWQAATFVHGDGNLHTYINIGGSVGLGGLGIGAGFKFNSESIHFYTTGCAADTGFGFSISLSNAPISTGWSAEASGYYMLGGSIDNSGSYEIGIGTKGYCAGATYTW